MISKLKSITNNEDVVMNCAIGISCLIPLLYIIYLSMSAHGMHSSISAVFETYPKEGLNVIRMSLMPFCAYILFNLRHKNEHQKTSIMILLALSQLLSLNFPLAVIMIYYLINFSSTKGIKNNIMQFKDLKMDVLLSASVAVLVLSILLAVVQVRVLL